MPAIRDRTTAMQGSGLPLLVCTMGCRPRAQWQPSTLALLVFGVQLAFGCAAPGARPEGPVAARAAEPSTPAISGEVTVLAAASLSDAFGEMGERFHAASPNATI